MDIDFEKRSAALSQAAHDHKGNAPAETVVARAQVYYAFLCGTGSSPEPLCSWETPGLQNRDALGANTSGNVSNAGYLSAYNALEGTGTGLQNELRDGGDLQAA